MSERQALPEELELMAAGPELAVLLGSVDRARLSEQDRVRLVQARNRLVSHQQAQLLADVYAVSWGEPPEDEPGQASRYPWAEVELAFALRWTRIASGGRLEQARQLIEDLPAVQEALSAGQIDMPKALVIAELAGWLEDVETARRLVDAVIDQAPRLTTGQLRARLRRLVLAIDPQAARRRCATAVTTRRVESFDNPDGTGELWGRSLPPQDTAAVWQRLTAIARSAKTAGDPRSIDQLRADALLDLLAGEGVAVGGPITSHTAGLPNDEAEPAEPEPASPGWDPAWPSQPPPDPDLDDARVRPAAAAVAAPPRRGVVDLQVPLVTLLRLAELPGELGGWGPVIADIARQVATKQTDGTWRFSVYDQLGELAFHGITRQRPTAQTAAYVQARDHTCIASGCRRPATGCDLDHTIAKRHGGHSGPSNLGSLCRLHHRFKHTAGADLIQLRPGVFGWSTPRGMQYVTTPHRPLLTV